MRAKDYLLLFLASLFILGIFAYFQSAPGYMDAEYYYAMGLRIARDKTLSEPFVWNYLNGFSGIPIPGFAFWMPFPAVVAALNMMITRWYTFFIARIGFVILAGLVPVLTANTAFRLLGSRKYALLAGFFATFSGFYAPFLTTTDGFGIVMLIGACFWLTTLHNEYKYKYLLLGLLAGLMHMTRADGFLWIIAGIYLGLAEEKEKLFSLLKLITGYMIVLAPWFGRNWATFGTIFPPGSSKMLWLSSYDDLFLFNTDTLNSLNLFKHNVYELIDARLAAVLANLKTIIIIQWQIILLPLILVGIIRCWSNKNIRAIVWVWIAVFAIMSFVFPYAGTRGGFFHSGAAFQPLFWTMGALGLSAVIEWGKLKRDWIPDQARNFLGFGITIILAGMTFFVLKDRVIGSDKTNPQWNQSYHAAVEIGDVLEQLDIPAETIIMINNPPGLYIATERSAVVIPSGDIDQLKQAADETEAKYLILERNHPIALEELYKHPDKFPQFVHLITQSETHYFMIP